MRCSNCGAEIQSGELFCGECGRGLNTQQLSSIDEHHVPSAPLNENAPVVSGSRFLRRGWRRLFGWTLAITGGFIALFLFVPGLWSTVTWPFATDAEKAFVLFETGRWKEDSHNKIAEAEALYQDAIKLDPNEPRYRSDFGKSLASRGKWAEAEAQHREAVRLRPDDPIYRAGLAEALLKQGRRAEALKEAQEAKRLKPYVRFDDEEVEKELGLSVDPARSNPTGR